MGHLDKEAIYETEMEFARFVSQLCNTLAQRCVAAGMTEADAHTNTADLLLLFAARIAVNTKIHLIGGEPDPEKWEKASRRAFAKILEANAVRTKDVAKKGEA